MRIHVAYTLDLADEDVAAFARYNRLDTCRRNYVRAAIKQALVDLGQMGVDEQVHEGHNIAPDSVDEEGG